MKEFLQSTKIIDWDHPAVLQKARLLAGSGDPIGIAKSCFDWVRDEVLHSRDYEKNPVTCRASDVLLHRTGYCFAKSHLLAALLRANQIPAGFCYQRLSVNDFGPPYTLHGYNAVNLPDYGWYRVDARGNRAGINAQFTPPVERLAFSLQSADEVEFANILPDPLDCVVETLHASRTWQGVLSNLPDLKPETFAATSLTVLRTGIATEVLPQ
jgi:transglutaminase-like putative cysteine protease